MAGQWRGRFWQWRGRFLSFDFPRIRAHVGTVYTLCHAEKRECAGGRGAGGGAETTCLAGKYQRPAGDERQLTGALMRADPQAAREAPVSRQMFKRIHLAHIWRPGTRDHGVLCCWEWDDSARPRGSLCNYMTAMSHSL